MHIFIFEYPLAVFIARCLAISMDPMQKLYIESVAYDICSTLIAVWIWNEHFVIRCCTYCTQLEIHVQIHLRPIEINYVLVVFMSAHNVNYKCKWNQKKRNWTVNDDLSNQNWQIPQIKVWSFAIQLHNNQSRKKIAWNDDFVWFKWWRIWRLRVIDALTPINVNAEMRTDIY